MRHLHQGGDADQHGVAIRRGLGDQVVAENAARAGAVFHHHLLAPRFGEFGGDQPANDVGAAACRVGHDEADWFVRVGLGGDVD